MSERQKLIDFVMSLNDEQVDKLVDRLPTLQSVITEPKQTTAPKRANRVVAAETPLPFQKKAETTTPFQRVKR